MPQLTPSPKFHVDDELGNPAVGWKLYSYLAGTSTPKATYPLYTLGAANPNPTILDARGEATIFLDGNYKLVLKDENDATIWTVDDVRDITSSATFSGATLSGTLTITSTNVTWSGNPTHSGNHTFTNNVTIKGNTSIGDANTDTLTIAPNAVTWTNNPTHSGTHTFGTLNVSGTLTASAVAPVFTFGSTFGNTARSGATVLDWYEEVASFTPAIVPTSGSGITYLIQKGMATRIGDRVAFDIYIGVSSLGTASGTFYISGLPFNVRNTGGSGIPNFGASVGEYGNFTGLTGALIASPLSASSRVYLEQTGATGTSILTIASLTASAFFCISGIYPA